MPFDPHKNMIAMKFALIGPSEDVGSTYKSMRRFLADELTEESHTLGGRTTRSSFDDTYGGVDLSSSRHGFANPGWRRLEISFAYNASNPFGPQIAANHVERLLDSARDRGIGLNGLHAVPYFERKVAA